MNNAIRLHRNAPLLTRNTFHVTAHASWLIEIADNAVLLNALSSPLFKESEHLLTIGSGSNLLFVTNPPGIVLSMRTSSIHIIEDNDEYTIVRADAGTLWHDLVLWTLKRGLSGLENLALIPGTVGAAPIQNIGAYGVEIAQLIHVVEAIDIADRQLYRFDRESCHFSYRDSRFKQEADRYLVTAVELALSRRPVLRLGYTGIHKELAAMSIDDPSAHDVAQAVIRLRRHKLPDPEVLGNAGSFFKNPIVPATDALALHDKYPQLPVFETQDKTTRKLSAAWLIDACGWKGHRDGDAGIAPSHALVLVNHGHATGIELLSLARKVADSVYERFRIRLEPEPRLIGALW